MDKLNGFYRGMVIKHCEFGKCKIYIPGVYDEEYSKQEKSDFLPDAEQVSTIFGGAVDGKGVFSYPNISSVVVCGFFNGDQNFPFYIGTTLGGNNEPDNDKSAQSEWNRIRPMDESHIHVIHAKDADIEMSESGNIKIKTRDTYKGAEQCEISLNSQGEITIMSSKKISITSPTVEITAKDCFNVNSNNIKLKGPDDNNPYASKIFQNARFVGIDATTSGSIQKTSKMGFGSI